MATSADKRTKSKTKKSSRHRLSAGSFLLSRTSRLSARCTWSLRKGLVSKVLGTADKVEQSLHTGIAANISEVTGFGELVSKPVKKAVAVGASKSVFFARGDGLRRAFLHTKARFFGIALLVFALYSAGIFFAKELMGWGFGDPSAADLITAAVVLLPALFLLFCGKPMSVFLGGSRLFCRIFSGILGMDEGALRDDGGETFTHGGIAFLAGTLAGVCTLFFAPHKVLLMLACAAFCLCIPAVPEMGLMAAVIGLPFMPLRYTAIPVAVALLGYVFKLIRLKRVFRFGVPELFMTLTVGICFLSALNTGDYFFLKRMLLFGTVWFLTLNLITTERLLRKYITALVYGGIFVLAISAWNLLPAVIDLPDVLGAIRFPAVMGSTVLKCYLMMMTPLALLHGRRCCGILLLALILLNGYLTGSLWVFGGVFLAILAYGVFARGAWVGAALTGAAVLPLAVAFGGERLGGLTVGFSRVAREIASRYVWTGVGSGNGALTTAALAEGLRLDGTVASLYTRLVLEGGILLPVLLLAGVFLAGQRMFTTLRNLTGGQEKKRTVLCGALAASAVLFLVGAAVSDVWTDLRILGVFFCICSAASLTGTLYGFEPTKEEEQQWI